MEITKQVIEINPNPIYVKNELGNFVLANSAYAALKGLSVEELLLNGTHELDYAHERDLDILESGETTKIEEFYKLKNGSKVWYETTKTPMAQPNGVYYLLSVSSEITDWKETVVAATESVKAKDAFLTNMTNEIVTPINAIIGMARLIKKSFLNKAQEEYLNIILSIADNLLSLPANIVDYAKINAGELRVEFIPFNISATLRDTVRSLEASATEQGLSLIYKEPATNIPIVEGDPFRLNQILINLIKNAIKFTKKGEIIVSSEVVDTTNHDLTIEFCVQDTGIGMTEEQFNNLLHSLNQPNHSTSPLFAGTGLGLTICKNLIEAQNGQLWVESEPGQGSKFYFKLPFKVSEKSAADEQGQQPEKPMKGLDLLLVEDNQVNQLLTISQLEECDIKVDVAVDGEDALNKARIKNYDLILMDIQMPQLDGIEATTRIRKEHSPNKNTPIVAFTANAHKIDLGRYKSAGFTDYLLKPYNKTNLFLIISKYTGQPLRRKPASKLKFQVEQKPVALYDFSGLGDLAHDAVFIRRMQQLFLDTVPVQLHELQVAIEQKDWEQVTHITHRLKSTFGNIKITEAAEALKKLESIARTRKELHQAEELFAKVQQTTNKVLQVFAQLLQVES
ncbi:response regulator [Pontibacter qinzhouensis]|uniref:histidine kinase n=1 Tax=Pontibacter qinzhouensis TaxID=2603253 RepID=A0A5C8JAP9_9BACT|nr:ATP-binding protein [Pontibacter qinzhouensis]TXK33794.1 response regulator [Pontibacter qinzhouensis]